MGSLNDFKGPEVRNLIIKSSSIRFILSALIISFLIASVFYYINPHFFTYSVIAFYYALFSAMIFRVYFNSKAKTKRHIAYLGIPFLMFAFWVTVHSMFDDFNVQALIYHAKYGFTSDGIPKPYLFFSIFSFIGSLMVVGALSFGVRQSHIFSQIDTLAFVPLILLNPLVFETAEGFGIGNIDRQVLSANYHPITALKHDGSPRPNIIHIFLESAEQTLENEEDFGPAMRPLLEFKKKGLYATNINQIKNTEWTIAGAVAAYCGVPLIQPWLATRNTDNIDGRFMPNATCLGDILKSDGYRTEYMQGADIRFAGTDLFTRDHGFTSVMGLQELFEFYPNNKNYWGLSDKAIFTHAEKTFRELSAKDQPFLITVTSIGGHGPSGYASKACVNGPISIKSTEPMGIGIECANALTRDMLHSLDADGLLENTVVIIQSDHLMMGSDFTARLNEMDRRDLFMAFGPNIKSEEIDRSASMIDIYPTILAMLGYKVPDDTAGLGVSLYSDKQNLLEVLGLEKLDEAIVYDADLRRLLWLDSDAANDLTAAIH